MLFEAANEDVITGGARQVARIHYNVDSWQRMLVKSKRFSNQPLHPITSHGIANNACRNRKTQAGPGIFAGTNKHCKACVAEATRIAINAIKLDFGAEAVRRGERPLGRVQAQCGVARVRQSGAYALWHDGVTAPAGQREWPCVRESHACACDADY